MLRLMVYKFQINVICDNPYLYCWQGKHSPCVEIPTQCSVPHNKKY